MGLISLYAERRTLNSSDHNHDSSNVDLTSQDLLSSSGYVADEEHSTYRHAAEWPAPKEALQGSELIHACCSTIMIRPMCWGQ